MKIIRIVGHPIAVMSVFMLLLLSGDSFGGFYLLFLILGLPHAVPHAILSTAGLLSTFAGYKIYRKNFNVIKPLLYVAGIALMICGLITFFNASPGYAANTFNQVVPLISFCIFGICILCNFLLVFLQIFKDNSRNGGNKLSIAS